MKSFHIIRANRPTLVLELSFWDMLRMLFGREIMLLETGDEIVLRHQHGYTIFNLAAPRAE